MDSTRILAPCFHAPMCVICLLSAPYLHFGRGASRAQSRRKYCLARHVWGVGRQKLGRQRFHPDILFPGAKAAHAIREKEHSLSLGLRLASLLKTGNDLVFYVTNQYDAALPFFAIPLGGPPRSRYNVDVKIRK